MSRTRDLVVLGVGMAGLNAANRRAREGWSVAVVDPRPYGGTCALRGCDPKKMLRRGAEIVDAAWLMAGRGVCEGDLRIDWAELMAHKRSFTDRVPDTIESGLDDKGVATLHGPARFTGERALEVNGETIEAGHVLIATGQRPRDLGVPGAELATDSTGFLELDELPRRILFVGGGYVSMEFAHIAARAGGKRHRGRSRGAAAQYVRFRPRRRSRRALVRARDRFRGVRFSGLDRVRGRRAARDL